MVMLQTRLQQPAGQKLTIRKTSNLKAHFQKKRKLRATEQERRHKEKMKRLYRFNDLFEKMVNKMPKPKD